MTEKSTTTKSDKAANNSKGDKAEKKAEKTTEKMESGTVNPEGQKRITDDYRDSWDRIWGEKS